MSRCFSVTLVFLLSTSAFAQTSSARQPLTIEAIFAPGGITGRPPEAIKWSPDGSKFAFIQRDNSGERGELWFVEAASSEKKLVVNDTKLASLAPSPAAPVAEPDGSPSAKIVITTSRVSAGFAKG